MQFKCFLTRTHTCTPSKLDAFLKVYLPQTRGAETTVDKTPYLSLQSRHKRLSTFVASQMLMLVRHLAVHLSCLSPFICLYRVKNRIRKYSGMALLLLSQVPRLDQIQLAQKEPIRA